LDFLQQHLDPKHIAAGAAIGAGAGALSGFVGRAIHTHYDNARKMGYGKFGRVANAITPLAALTTPKSQK